MSSATVPYVERFVSRVEFSAKPDGRELRVVAQPDTERPVTMPDLLPEELTIAEARAAVELLKAGIAAAHAEADTEAAEEASA